MKHISPRIRMLLIALMAVTAIQARIIQTTIDDIEYSLNTDTRTAAVTNAYGSFLHTLYIPEKVTYQQAEFTVTEIANSAFQYKTSLTNITLPATLTKIGEGAFTRCSSLTHIFCNMEIPVALDTNGFYWEKEPYADCTIHVIPGKAEAYRQANVWNKFQHIEDNIDAVKIEIIENIPYFLDGEKKTAAVMKRDFYYGGHIVIPDEVTCDNIEYTVTAIEHGAFYSCDGNNPIKGITLPKGLEKIGQYALYGIGDKPIYCYSETPAEIYENSFNENYSFSNILHIKPGTRETYGNADVWKNFANTVEDLTSDATVRINDNVYQLSDAPEKTATLIFCRNKSGDVRIPDNVSYKGLKYIVTGIGEETFKWCDLTGITLPKDLRSIGDKAFYNCDKLTAVTLPSSLTDIGEEVFSWCSSLSDVTLPEGITELGYGMFYYCSALTNITLPQSLESIASRAFQYSGLTNITLPQNLTEIGGYAFFGCRKLTGFQVSPQSINYASADGVLFSADHSTLVAYPAGKENTTYIVPENVTEIQYTAFCSCDKLTRITLPQGITGIYWGTFSYCTELTDINIPQGVNIIDVYAFENCRKLTHITLPENICFIGESAFTACSGLTDIYSCIDNPQNVEFSKWDEDIISPWDKETNTGCTLHVKPGLKDTYRDAEIWKNFTNILDDLTTGIEDMKTNDNGCIELNGNKLTLGEAAWTVITLSGRVAAQGTSKETLCLPAGIYVVRCGNTVKKIHIQ